MENIYFETLGCSRNQVDSEKMLCLLEKEGFAITSDPCDAHIIIVNTCCFIKSAKEESIETILELSKYKKNGKCEKLIVTGCLSQYYSNVLKEEIPEINIVFGVRNIKDIIKIISLDNAVVLPNPDKKDDLFERKLLSFPGTAYLKISEGCNNNCSYCIIPKIKGGLKSRKIENILKETDFLIKHNIKEIIITAQDTADYGIDIYKKRMLLDLILEIEEKMDYPCWIRTLYMHPDHIDPDFLSKISESKYFLPYFDLPFQSGSNKILKLMNRKGTKEKYLDLIKEIRNIFKNPVLRSSFITGFPDENDDDFEETLDFIKKAEFDWVGGFTYSQEEDTKAGKMKKQINESIKKKRLLKLYQVSEEITRQRIKRFINTKQNILVEERVEDEDLFIGRFWGQSPDVDGLTVIAGKDAPIGCFKEVEIRKLNDKDLYGS